MARTIAQIQQSIYEVVDANDTLKTRLYATSVVSIFRLIAFVVSSVIWAFEVILDTHKDGTQAIIRNEKAHTPMWYRQKAFAFQYGYDLMPDSDVYAIDDPTARIIAYCAVDEIETTEGLFLNIKVAKDVDGLLAQLTGEWPTINEPGSGSGEKLAFANYFKRIKDAGVWIRFVSRDADSLRLNLEVYYDPLVIDGTGKRLDGTNDEPLQDAIDNYLQNLKFNGEYSNVKLTDAMQAVDGIVLPQILGAEAKYGDNQYANINTLYVAEAGWLKIYDDETDLNITWIPYESNV